MLPLVISVLLLAVFIVFFFSLPNDDVEAEKWCHNGRTGELKNRLKDLLLVHRKELKGKWWHRLANVLIVTSTILVVIFSYFIFLNTYDWKKYKYTSYSFEPGYSLSEGKEENCDFHGYSYSGPSVFCGDLHNSKDFLDRYGIRYLTPGSTLMYYEKSLYNILDKEVKRAKTLGYKEATYDDVLSYMMDKDEIQNIRVKKTIVIEYVELFKAVFYPFFIAFMWFVFWQSIVYRTIIYIAFGEKKE